MQVYRDYTHRAHIHDLNMPDGIDQGPTELQKELLTTTTKSAEAEGVGKACFQEHNHGEKPRSGLAVTTLLGVHLRGEGHKFSPLNLICEQVGYPAYLKGC